jgi:myosin regulatory light chain 12
MSSAKAKGNRAHQRGQRAKRATSNVFAMFDQAQIQEFKEAFSMIDQNKDGFIDKEDLHDMLASLGLTCSFHLIIVITLLIRHLCIVLHI